MNMLKHVHITEKVHRSFYDEVGMLLNFGPKPEFKRVVLENARKRIRVNARESAVSY